MVSYIRKKHGEAFNAEPDASTLTSSLITPQKELYRRNHDDIIYQPASTSSKPEVETDWKLSFLVDRDVAEHLDWKQWKSDTSFSPRSAQAEDHDAIIASSKSVRISIAELHQSMKEKRVVAAMECAGNRRADMSERGPRKAEGLQWQSATIGNALWAGASVRDFLLQQGIPDAYEHIRDKENLPPTVRSLENDSAPWSRNTYLHFLSSQPCSESQSPTGHVYGSSVPLCTALHPNQDLLLAWGVDGQRLDSTHGYPLRAALPGHVAARWTKWLSMLRISFYEDDSPPMTLDYKLLEPPKGASEEERRQWIDSMMGEGKDEKKREAEVAKAKPLMRLGVGSGVSEPQEDDKIEVNDKGEMAAEGYAVGTEGSPVSLVELLLVRDPGSSNLDAMEDLRRAANEQPASAWTRLELDESNSRKVLPKHKGSSEDDIAIADAKEAKFSWSWTLWRAQVPVPAEARGSGEKYALVMRGTTSAGVRQELQSPWNIRGFRERSWPVVTGLTFQ
ncbi:molybdopterin binding oxidoreductase [Microstroma glucosiphilum]|uniref:Molybdopterin binding oxidoreductase n=1 Tax=Pseudomicrostroma glucosiphilum TaxID=1684307 RepID=A0A316U992_9BASI|nr:molybdopterin binding oxidoreductase [Pseudomicrostroma glucosiphilum]PWN20953.1 molybdopterin binding oxidoreductase [Pseudomicrostroma glucosiphilum]